MSITLHSTSFADGHPIPRRATGDGEDLSPPLRWSTVPAETQELVLIVDDPDAPTPEPWVHWIIYGIAPGLEGLNEGVPPVSRPESPAGAKQGLNSWESPGYRGPAPPHGHGVHHYHFKLYALDEALDLAPGLDKRELMQQMSGHILGHGELVGTYQR